jgi:hypothetical protein
MGTSYRNTTDLIYSAGATLRSSAGLCPRISKIQPAALALYRNARYRVVHEETVEVLSNKTVGSGILRYYLEKALRQNRISRCCSW